MSRAAEVKPEILIEPAPGNYLCFSGDGVPQILLEEAMVTAGVCDEDVGDLKMEDPCLILSGRITNYDPEGWDGHAMGRWLRRDRRQGRAIRRSRRVIPGQVGIDAPYQETVAFLMHLNAPQEVRNHPTPRPELQL
jgi:hypothetical protein